MLRNPKSQVLLNHPLINTSITLVREVFALVAVNAKELGARALYKESQLLILDEATSALDIMEKRMENLRS